MTVKSLLAAAAITAAASSSTLAATDGLGILSPSASFSNTVSGSFTDVRTFNLDQLSNLAVSLTKSTLSFGALGFGGILGFSTSLNALPLASETFTFTTDAITLNTRVLAGGSVLQAGIDQLTVSGTGVSGGPAINSGNHGASPVAAAAAVPEPNRYVMFLAGLGVMGAIAFRRNKNRNSG